MENFSLKISHKISLIEYQKYIINIDWIHVHMGA